MQMPSVTISSGDTSTKTRHRLILGNLSHALFILVCAHLMILHASYRQFRLALHALIYFEWPRHMASGYARHSTTSRYRQRFPPLRRPLSAAYQASMSPAFDTKLSHARAVCSPFHRAATILLKKRWLSANFSDNGITAL